MKGILSFLGSEMSPLDAKVFRICRVSREAVSFAWALLTL
jgi:hypothetical protein